MGKQPSIVKQTNATARMTPKENENLGRIVWDLENSVAFGMGGKAVERLFSGVMQISRTAEGLVGECGWVRFGCGSLTVFLIRFIGLWNYVGFFLLMEVTSKYLTLRDTKITLNSRLILTHKLYCYQDRSFREIKK